MIHIAQHFRSQVDSNATSYSAEHDASRLNLPLLWLVLQQPGSGLVHEEDAAWWPSVLMLQSLNTGFQSMQLLRGEGSEQAWQAYRAWADSFGLTPPNEAFQAVSALAGSADSDAMLFNLESWSKQVITAEALGAVAMQQCPEPSEEHFRELLQAAFHADRTGDVYSAENRALRR